jgi:hypothetical protein
MSPQKLSTSPPNAPPPAPPVRESLMGKVEGSTNCLAFQMAPPPPMPNGNLSNGMPKPANIITPNNNHAGLLRQIESGELKSIGFSEAFR